MQEPKLKKRIQGILDDFVLGLKNVYEDNLVSAILYGSAASGEFIEKHSNLNILLILKNLDLQNLRKCSHLINMRKFRIIHPLFFTEESLKDSNDIFPIEFLDMKENYRVLLGKDVVKDISIDPRNLRFQCEHELAVKLIALRHLYLRRNKDREELLNSMFRYFTSCTHILRNLLRLKGIAPPYLKQDIIREAAADFPVSREIWEEILAAKNKQIRLNSVEIEKLFMGFVNDLEKIVNLLNKL